MLKMQEGLPRLRKPSPLAQPADSEKPSTLLPPSSPAAEESEPRSPILLSYDELPVWYQDNDCIRSGYRPASDSTSACFASWLYLHNESVNIYSHLLPAVAFLLFQAVFHSLLQAIYPRSTTADHLVLAFFLLAAAICLGLSAIYHTMMSHSEELALAWLRLDFVGIVVLTLGDFVSGIYLVFYCEPTLQKVYWSMIIFLGVVTMVALVSPRFQGRPWRTFRVCVFVGTGLSGLAPLAYGIAVFGFDQMMKQSGMPYYIGEGLLLILGAVFYTARCPEILKPGRFDYFGCSHQIFHMLVVLATVLHLVGIVRAYDYNYHYRPCGGGYSP